MFKEMQELRYTMPAHTEQVRSRNPPLPLKRRDVGSKFGVAATRNAGIAGKTRISGPPLPGAVQSRAYPAQQITAKIYTKQLLRLAAQHNAVRARSALRDRDDYSSFL